MLSEQKTEKVGVSKFIDTDRVSFESLSIIFETFRLRFVFIGSCIKISIAARSSSPETG